MTLETIISLIILFAVIIDPPLSFAFFITSTKYMTKKEKIRVASYAMILAFCISFIFLLGGEFILKIFSISLNELRIAGGIILGILGTKMALGLTVTKNIDEYENKHQQSGIASIIATPLISGPACITTILVSSIDYGKLITGIALSFVLLATALLLFISIFIKNQTFGETGIKVTTTIMGMITLAWGVSFILTGLGLS
jgi:multiple antibiotic resistance protein